MIGVLAGWHAYSGGLHSFLYKVFRGLRAAAYEHDAHLLLACGMGPALGSQRRPAWPAPALDSDFVPVGPWNTDGLIVITPLITTARSQYIQDLRAAGHPVVFIGCGEEGPTVAADNAGGIHQAVEHLVQHGHRRIAFLAGGHGANDDSAERLEAFKTARAALGLPCDERLMVNGQHSVDGGEAAVRTLLAAGVPFTAVVASNDEAAMGALQALRAAGQRVPHDVAVIGFDDVLPDMAQQPPLSSVHYPATAVGYEALELLLAQGLHAQRTDEVMVRIPTRLVTRESCGCLPSAPLAGPASPLLHAAHPMDEAAWAAATAHAMGAAVRNEAQRVTEAVLTPARHLRPAEIDAHCQQLVSALLASRQSGSAAPFLAVLLDLLQSVEAAHDDAHAWQAAISVLEQAAPRLAGGATEWPALLAQLCQRARTVISHSVRQTYARVVVDQHGISSEMGRLTADLLLALDPDRILDTLARYLPAMGLRRAYVAAFEPEGEAAYAWSSLESGPGRPPLRFRSQSFPPPALVEPEQPFSLALLPLRVQDEAYGYVAFEGANLDICASVVRALASALQSARLYRAAAEGQRLADEANRLKSRFLSLVSHELRTPLDLIVGLSHRLLQEQPGLNELPAPYRDEVAKIHASAEHLGWLIRDVLDLASSQVGQLRLKAEALDLTEALAVAATVGERLAREKGLAWEAHWPDSLPRVWGDRARLQQVLLNLISNAVKFTAEGGVTLRATAEGPSLRVSVSDTGLGIPPEEQAMIFDEFSQSDRTAARGYGGLGLGLAVCKRLMELHGGEIGVDSLGTEPAGSTFYFRLPALDEATQRLSAGELTTALARLGLGLDAHDSAKTIVIVDDEPGMLDLHARLVQTHWPAYHVIKARGGQAAVELIQELLPDLVLLDLKMPEVDGFAVLERLRAQATTRDIPVLVLTSQVLAEADMARLNQGVTAVLGKGLFKPAETLTQVEAALGGGAPASTETRRLVRKAMAYIHARYADPLTRDEIARHVGVSASYLARCFRQDLGVAPMEYLARCRVHQAQQLLTTSSQAITEVALAVGFASASAFTQAFEREAGVSPRAYRQGKRAS